ncbi:hypothetical protein BpHYR1_001009 [Brachionus plicatilis]|uniref:Uncharacterized protein n=1 Tax=Brachionus plicatilis TaxID=10195 RepID=A0A3M7PC55_BRAPC|nr:hypothetical protein BpHYR1_001009 [Brachionus plicatilis]
MENYKQMINRKIQICMSARYYLILPRIIQLKLLGNLNHWKTYLKPTKIYSKAPNYITLYSSHFILLQN